MKTPKTPAKRGGFTEYTYTDGECEVMLHVDAKGRNLRVYTYAKDAPSFNEHENENGKPITPFRWEAGANPLFLHLPRSQVARFVSLFLDSGEMVCTEREDDPDAF